MFLTDIGESPFKLHAVSSKTKSSYAKQKLNSTFIYQLIVIVYIILEIDWSKKNLKKIYLIVCV